MSLHYFHRYAEPFLKYAIVIPYFDYGLVNILGLVLQHDRKTNREFQVTRLKVKVIMSHKIKKTLFPVKLLWMFSMQRLLTSYSISRWKEAASCLTLGQKIKGQPSGDFLVALIFWQNILTHLGQCFFLNCTHVQDDDRKMPRKFEDKLSLIRFSKSRCPKALDDFANLSVLCQVVRFTYAFCYQFLLIFCCFWIFPHDRIGFSDLQNTRK